MSKSSGYSPHQIAASGADYVKLIAPFVDAADLQKALAIALNGSRKQYSKTLILTLEREIRRKVKAAEKEQKLRLTQKAWVC